MSNTPDGESLQDRVVQFMTGRLPGQCGVHMGTSYLVHDLVHELMAAKDSASRLASELARVTGERDAAMVDANRYRWWTQNHGVEYDGPGTFKLYALVRTQKVRTKDLFDAAIDAAIAAGARGE